MIERLHELRVRAILLCKQSDPGRIGYGRTEHGRGFTMPVRGVSFRPPCSFKPRCPGETDHANTADGPIKGTQTCCQWFANSRRAYFGGGWAWLNNEGYDE